MKEQDATHSFEKKDANLCPVMTGEYCFNRGCGINHEKQCLMLNQNDKKSDVPSTLEFQKQHIEVLKAELTRLRSELQQKDKEINLREAQQDVMAADTVRLLDQIEYQNKSAKEDHDKIKKLEFELVQERELRKELTWVAEFGYSVMSVNHPRLAEVKSIIEKAKLNN